MSNVFRTLRSGWLVVLIPAIAAGAVAYGVARNQQVYKAQALLTLTPHSTDSASIVAGTTSSSIDLESYVAQQLPVFTSTATLERASKLAGLPASTIASDVSVEAATSGNVIVNAQDASAARATAAVNALGRGYLAERAAEDAQTLRAAAGTLDRQLRGILATLDGFPAHPGSVDQLRKQTLSSRFSSVTARRDELLGLAGLDRSAGRLVQPAAGAAAARSVVKLVALGILLGLLVGVALVFVREHLRDRVQSTDDLEAGDGVSVLGELPSVGRKLRRVPGGSPQLREALQTVWLRSQIEAGGPLKSVVVSSAEGKEGKTTVAAGLAAVCSGARARIVLVSTDFWHRDVETMFGIDPAAPGLADWLATAPAERAERRLEDLLQSPNVEGYDNLRILPAGSPAAVSSAVLAHRAFDEALRQLAGVADIVILDSPPVLAMPYALVVAQSADAVLFVVTPGQSGRRTMARARRALAEASRNVGIVVNRSPDAVSYGTPAAREADTAGV